MASSSSGGEPPTSSGGGGGSSTGAGPGAANGGAARSATGGARGRSAAAIMRISRSFARARARRSRAETISASTTACRAATAASVVWGGGLVILVCMGGCPGRRYGCPGCPAAVRYAPLRFFWHAWPAWNWPSACKTACKTALVARVFKTRFLHISTSGQLIDGANPPPTAATTTRRGRPGP